MPFIIVLSVSVVAVVVLLTTDLALPWKLVAAGIVAASAAMQFIPRCAPTSWFLSSCR